MLELLHLENLGPSPEMHLDLAPRLNILTGDNGLGKSFLLDIAWWALTRRWPAEVNPNLTTGRMARPSNHEAATIEFRFTGKGSAESYRSTFDRAQQTWTGRAGRPSNPGLVLYAQVDGSFALWDPARNYWRKKGAVEVQDRPPAYVFSSREVWDGLRTEQGATCRGLIDDWAGWQKEAGEVSRHLTAVLDALSPDDSERLEPGKLTRVSLDDTRDIPTLRMPYGQDVPVVQASAGMRRIIALAYLLVWCWQEHVHASDLLGQATARQVIFLIDEIEAHLHPKWQRTIVSALLRVVQELSPDIKVQLVTATHSPLVLASIEPWFDPATDAWFDLDLVTGGEVPTVKVDKRTWVRHGDAADWLTSEAFDLGGAGSLEREQVLGMAAEALSDPQFDQNRARSLEPQLRRVLPDTDDFWINWNAVGRAHGWLR